MFRGILTLAFWTQRMGVGPFFRVEHVPLEGGRYRGQPAKLDISTAFGYWGDMQVELIRQHDASASVFKAWTDAGSSGVHPFCIQVEDLEDVRARCIRAGGAVVQEAWMPNAGHFIYADLGTGPGALIEFAQLHPSFAKLFRYMRETARNWDGAEPLRDLPPQAVWAP